MLQQFALGVYLRQNLLQFLFTPKYSENRPDAMFRDYTEVNNSVIHDNSVFLYNTPKQSGGKGVVYVYLHVVHALNQLLNRKLSYFNLDFRDLNGFGFKYQIKIVTIVSLLL